MSSATSKSRGWLITLIAGSVFALYVSCFFLPSQKSIVAIRKEVAEKRQAIAMANIQSSSLTKLESQLQHAVQVANNWKQFSPQDRHIVALLGQLASIAKQSGVRVQRLSPQEPVPMATLSQHSVVLNVEGGFEQLMAFLAQLENLPESIWVRQLGMKPNGENGMSVQCDLMLTVFADNREVSG